MTERQLKELVLIVYRYEQYRGGKEIVKKMDAVIGAVKDLPDERLDSMLQGSVKTLESVIGGKIWGEKE